jgi:hypothetical protein
MPNDHEPPVDGTLAERLTARAVPAPPPMPTARAAAASAVSAQAEPTAAKPATGGWAVDADRLREFVYAIERVKDKLWDVQAQVDLMRSAAFTPNLGTSPVARQLEQKFADRLDTPLDNPDQPTDGGLRPMLAEAMRRMEEFVAGAETAARNYREVDQASAQHHYGPYGTGG